MVAQYHSAGDVLTDVSPDRLEHEDSRRLLAACLRHPAFEVLELRRIERPPSGVAPTQTVDGIVVECCDGTVPSRNAPGVKNRERLLLLHGPGLLTPHEVRPLRQEFPVTPHQNHVPFGEPASLCLYFEPWSAVERTWTPARHLERILWWLRETALGTLHRSDQPLERLYFVSPFQIVLPPDFNERATSQLETLQVVRARSRSDGTVLRGNFVEKASAKAHTNDIGQDSLVVAVPMIVSAQVEQYPVTLGGLHDQLVRYGSELLSPLVAAAKKAMPEIGLSIHDQPGKHTLLLLQVPLSRAAQDGLERTDVTGFFVHDTPLVRLGIACGAYIDGKSGQAYVNTDIPFAGNTEPKVESIEEWRKLIIEPIDVRFAFTVKDARRASGVSDEGSDFQGVLAGVGALGSSMAELWRREGWGSWTYIDDDILHAHNIVRHTGKDQHIGWAKVDVVAHLDELSWPAAPKPKPIPAKVTDLTNTEAQSAISSASLLVDATTTLEAPRDLSDRDTSPRMASVFLTPAGRDSVLLLEDAGRTVRLSSLEAQYYRAILNRSWGAKHLVGHLGTYWVGAGCRDLSGVLPQEIVQLQGATLARQVRLLSARPDAQIRVWALNEETGTLTADIVPVAASVEGTVEGWRIIWDEGLALKLREIRAIALPDETGGIILGYVDQKRKAVNIVDVLPAPSDSEANQTGFTRGAEGLKEALERCSALTANIVGYLGEWHSHPRFSSATPSVADAALLAYLADTLSKEEIPALMVIVGETSISISIGEGRV